MGNITSVDSLRTAALANAGSFAAAFARAPKSIQFKGRTYLRDSARSVEQRLWYLAAAAQTQPTIVRSIAAGSYSLDEVFGLDPDRSGMDDANRRVREAEATVRALTGKVDQLKRMIRSFEQREADARQRSKECDRALTGSTGGDILAGVLTLGGSEVARQAKIAACRAYEDGQVQLWRDRQQAFKTGAMVGMAGQEGFAVPVNDGLEQNEAKLTAARAEVEAAKRDAAEARRQYDAEARRMRQEEEAARRAQAEDEAARRQAEAEAAARDQAAAGRAAAAQSAYESNEGGGYTPDDYTSDPSTWETVSGAEVEPDFGDDYFEPDELDETDALESARQLFGGDEALARAYAEDVLGVDDAEAIASLSYISPFSFDAYYGADCPGGCDGHCDTCDGVAELRAAMLDGGWGFDAGAYFADKLGDADEQGGSRLTGSADTPFDFASVIPLIMSAVLMLAPMILKAFGAPVSMEEANPPKSVIDDVRAQQPVSVPEKSGLGDGEKNALALGALGLGLKLAGVL